MSLRTHAARALSNALLILLLAVTVFPVDAGPFDPREDDDQ